MRIFLTIAFAFLVGACQTTYQKDTGWGGGYSDQMISDNVAIVHFKSNSLTSKIETEKMAMRRAAELTQEKGFDGFVIKEGRNTEKVDTSYTPGTTMTNCYDYGYSGTRCTTSTSSGYTTTSRKPRTEMRIRMVKHPIPKGTGWYDARQVLKHVVEPAKKKS